jgi:hypothetical protein
LGRDITYTKKQGTIYTAQYLTTMTKTIRVLS